MKPEELIACIKAQAEGKRIEFRSLGHPNGPWYKKCANIDQWDTFSTEYRIAREPRKCWVKWHLNTDYHCPWEIISSTEQLGPGWQLVVEEIN